MRKWVIAGSVSVILLLAISRIEYRPSHPTVPPGVQRSECLIPLPEGESGWDGLSRQGGRINRYPNARWQGNAYTAADIAQGRDLSRYDKIELQDSEHRHPGQISRALAQARIFLWEHWRNQKRGYLILTMSSVDHTGTAHVFIEPDDSGRWRAYRRQVDARKLMDEPTAYWVLWVRPNGWDKPGIPLLPGQEPDSAIHKLEFRDVCGEKSGNL